MIYDFKKQLRSGQTHEHFLDEYCRQWFEIREATYQEQRQGIDRGFTHKDNGALHTVEYKADTTASRTGNAFVETISVDTANKAGWAYTSKADWLLYYLPQDGLIYFWEFAKFRLHLPRWVRQFPTRAIPNKGYKTHGILVPLDEFEQHANKVINL